MTDHKHYTYRVTWDPNEEDFVAHCSEFPGKFSTRDTPEAALAALMSTTCADVERMKRNGESPPIPFAERAYSGVLKIRMPAQVHRALATIADEQRISLNRLIVAILASNLGGETPPRALL